MVTRRSLPGISNEEDGSKAGCTDTGRPGAISNKKFPTDRLNLVKDIFFFSCFSGLAYSDVKNLKQSDIVGGEERAQWIHSHSGITACERFFKNTRQIL
jgi:hypothetical protein